MKKMGAVINKSYELNDEQISVLREFYNGVGWKLFEIVIQHKFNREYKKLRNTRRRDESYERINGFLDGLDFVINSKDSLPQPERAVEESKDAGNTFSRDADG